MAWSYENLKRMTGCLVCVTAIEKGMSKTWEEGSLLYLAKTDPTFNNEVDLCAKAYEKLDPESLPRFAVPEQVEAVQELGSVSYVEFAFLSESQVMALTGCTPVQLQLELYNRLAEDGVTSPEIPKALKSRNSP